MVLYTEEALKRLPPELREDHGDNRILAVAVELRDQCDCPVIFVTKDTNLRIKADVVGLTAEDYESDKISIEELYSGTAEVLVDGSCRRPFLRPGLSRASSRSSSPTSV